MDGIGILLRDVVDRAFAVARCVDGVGGIPAAGQRRIGAAGLDRGFGFLSPADVDLPRCEQEQTGSGKAEEDQPHGPADHAFAKAATKSS